MPEQTEQSPQIFDPEGYNSAIPKERLSPAQKGALSEIKRGHVANRFYDLIDSFLRKFIPGKKGDEDLSREDDNPSIPQHSKLRRRMILGGGAALLTSAVSPFLAQGANNLRSSPPSPDADRKNKIDLGTLMDLNTGRWEPLPGAPAWSKKNIPNPIPDSESKPWELILITSPDEKVVASKKVQPYSVDKNYAHINLMDSQGPLEVSGGALVLVDFNISGNLSAPGEAAYVKVASGQSKSRREFIIAVKDGQVQLRFIESVQASGSNAEVTKNLFPANSGRDIKMGLIFNDNFREVTPVREDGSQMEKVILPQPLLVGGEVGVFAGAALGVSNEVNKLLIARPFSPNRRNHPQVNETDTRG